jgi:hypothetical protein
MCLRVPATRYATTAADFKRRLRSGGPYGTWDELLAHYQHLDTILSTRLTSFERKRYASLSHAPNKAMNLNSYMALMGRHLAVRRTHCGLDLYEAPPERADIAVPDADYILTLDADSLLEPSYKPAVGSRESRWRLNVASSSAHRKGNPLQTDTEGKDRTSAPPSYILIPYGSPLQGMASGLNGGLLIYAVGTFVGWRYG